MKPSDFIVAKCSKCKNIIYSYDDLNEFIENEENVCCNLEMDIIPKNQWTSVDYATIYGNILEDLNKYKLSEIPKNMIKEYKKQ